MTHWLCLLLGHREVLIDLEEKRSLGLLSADHVVLEETYLCTRNGCDHMRTAKVKGRYG